MTNCQAARKVVWPINCQTVFSERLIEWLLVYVADSLGFKKRMQVSRLNANTHRRRFLNDCAYIQGLFGLNKVTEVKSSHSLSFCVNVWEVYATTVNSHKYNNDLPQ